MSPFICLHDVMFQSRNRGSFDFKSDPNVKTPVFKLFQSRNRGSFDFKFAPQLNR